MREDLNIYYTNTFRRVLPNLKCFERVFGGIPQNFVVVIGENILVFGNLERFESFSQKFPTD